MIEERRYSKRELARLYWPETKNIKSALKNLRQDIKGCPELVAALQRTRWNVNRHSYSAEQVRLILKYLCEPGSTRDANGLHRGTGDVRTMQRDYPDS